MSVLAVHTASADNYRLPLRRCCVDSGDSWASVPTRSGTSTPLAGDVRVPIILASYKDIAFTIEALKLSASTYDIKDSSTLKILAELTREGDWSDVTLKPNESVDANFCNDNVKVELIENMIYNTSSIVLGASSQKVTFV